MNSLRGKSLSLFLILTFVGFPIGAYAAGPILVINQTPYKYSGAFKYVYDEGGLGGLSNSQARTYIEDALSPWNNLSTSTFSLESLGIYNTDINLSNYSQFSCSTSACMLGHTPIVFDTNGSIIDDEKGIGSSNHIIGSAGPRIYSNGIISESIVLLNGKFTDGISNANNPSDLTLGEFKVLVLHEFAHAFGVGHSQVNVDVYKNIKAGNPVSAYERESLPIMFPYLEVTNPLLRRDDRSSISMLYPNSTHTSNFGTIKGKVFRNNCTTPVQGANVVAYKKVTDNTYDEYEAVSCVSDYLIENNGQFTIEGLIPGNYFLKLEPIHTDFIGGSRVGPFANTSMDASFINPVPEGYFTEPKKNISLDVNQIGYITVSAGQTVSNQDIIATLTSIDCTDTDGDGTPDFNDGCPNDPNKTSAGICGCGTADTDSDSDGTPNCNDSCPNSAIKTSPGQCGCNIADTDSDGDGTANCNDGCPSDSNKTSAGICGCGMVDNATDTDSDGTADCVDGCPNDPNKIMAGQCGCGNVDTDTDSDGASDCNDQCPNDPNKTIPGVCGCGKTRCINVNGSNSLTITSLFKRNKLTLPVQVTNFGSLIQKCSVVDNGSEAVVRVKPKLVTFTPLKTLKSFKVTVPKTEAKNILDTNTGKQVKLKIICPNGEEDTHNIDLAPSE